MATMRDKAIAKSDELFPDYGDGASHGLSGGFIDGAVWVREDSKPVVAETDPTATLPQLYLGFIFNPGGTEGIEGEAVVHSDLESLRAILAAAVDEANLDEHEEPDAFSWRDDGTVYWPDANLRYGGFAWAKIQPVIPGFRLRVSELS